MAQRSAASPSVLMGWRCLFQTAALSHLLWAVMLLVTDPHDRWDCYGHGRAASAAQSAAAGAAARCQLSSADRQASVGFLICAFLARCCNPSGTSGVRAAVVLLLWNGALFFSGSGFSRLFGRGLSVAAGEAADTAPYYEVRDAAADLPRLLLIGHTCIAACGAAGYLLHFYMHLALTCTGDWVRSVRAPQRRPAAGGAQAAGQPVLVYVRPNQGDEAAPAHVNEDQAEDAERGARAVGFPSFSGLSPSAPAQAVRGGVVGESHVFDKSL